MQATSQGRRLFDFTPSITLTDVVTAVVWVPWQRNQNAAATAAAHIPGTWYVLRSILLDATRVRGTHSALRCDVAVPLMVVQADALPYIPGR